MKNRDDSYYAFYFVYFIVQSVGESFTGSGSYIIIFHRRKEWISFNRNDSIFYVSSQFFAKVFLLLIIPFTGFFCIIQCFNRKNYFEFFHLLHLKHQKNSL